MRTAAWYGDLPLDLAFPKDWDVTFHWPKTPPPLSDEKISSILDRPVGQPPIAELCRDKTRPLIIVDDLNRPTPAARVIPFLLRSFRKSGISSEQVRILVASGTHAPSPMSAVSRKVGVEAAASCRIILHDCKRDNVKIGRTSYGTPVFANHEVVTSDFVLGIGGVYPNHTAGFGGGSKLALGILGFQSILHLHYGHSGKGWGGSGKNYFRNELNEIAEMISLKTLISVHVNHRREPVGIRCGDYRVFYAEAAAFSSEAYSAPAPENEDVVISNAYPEDLSLTFAWMKGMEPLRRCARGASRIVIASCSEGTGHHGLFPFVNAPRFRRVQTGARSLYALGPRRFLRKAAAALRSRVKARFNKSGTALHSSAQNQRVPENPFWLYRPGSHAALFPSQIRGIQVKDSWEDIVQAVRGEQPGKKRLKVAVYPCAPLQCLLSPARTEEIVSSCEGERVLEASQV
ncbi:MAG: lactate racemase domain-containing protein [Candidatus Acidiferrales bacterium]